MDLCKHVVSIRVLSAKPTRLAPLARNALWLRAKEKKLKKEEGAKKKEEVGLAYMKLSYLLYIYDKLPEVLDFSKDLANLELAAKVLYSSKALHFIMVMEIVYLLELTSMITIQVQLKFVAEEMQVFTISISFTVGVTCANLDGKIVLEALILTSAVASSLTGYAFWASKKGKDFSYLGPILFTCLVTLFLTGMMQMFFPLGPTAHAIYGGIGAMIFNGYIVYDMFMI
ncbi:protein LIFEGUARD 1-like [Gastrolobium bilobum]|uniref:protein LIFEGUARD 1-like n=1 Tax=Gastrolobium bilobum TaxID=150636 RepID=UPI002AB20DB2|nr:protein LIFEGUARD 1-like [Gastrolobium bilobum]